MERISRSSEETRLLGQALGEQAFGSMIIALKGDLGAGKTELTKGFCAGLGCEQATSPTFTIMNVYEGGRLPVYHFDFYRCPGDIQEFEEYLFGDGVAIVEWAELAGLPEDILTVELLVTGEEERKIVLTAGSERYREVIRKCFAS